MKELLLIFVFLWVAMNWMMNEWPVVHQCDCPKLPENHFIVQTKETETCIDKNRNTIVTREVSSAKLEIGE